MEKTDTNEFGSGVAKGLIGALPGAMAAGDGGIVLGIAALGSIAAEMIGLSIPNKRIDRVEKMLNYTLAATINVDVRGLESRLLDPQFAALFEEGVYASAKAVTEERLKGIGSILNVGIREEMRCIIALKCMKTLQAMHDLELTIFEYIISNGHDTYTFNIDIFDKVKKFLIEKQGVLSQADEQDLDVVLEDSFNRLFRLDIVSTNDTSDGTPLDGVPTYTLTRYGIIFARYLNHNRPN